MRIVGLVGPKRSGKDTAASALVEQRGYVRVGFADAVKDLALRINPLIDFIPDMRQADRLSWWVEQYGWEYAKGRTEVRRFLQELGTGVRDVVGERSWVSAWANAAAPAAACWPVVVPDVRFTNEAEYLRQQDAQTLLIRITRPGLDLSDSQSSTKFEVAGDRSLRSTIDNHVSETEQARIECDHEIVNDNTEHWLHGEVLNIVDLWSA